MLCRRYYFVSVYLRLLVFFVNFNLNLTMDIAIKLLQTILVGIMINSF